MLLVLLLVALPGLARAAPKNDAAAGASLVHFPSDQANHPAVHNEWWYVVGHLKSGRRTFGFEVTLFRFAKLRLPGFPTAVSIFRADVAITDESRHQFRQHVSYYFPESASMSATRLDERVGPASISGLSPAEMNVSASLPGGKIALHLVSKRPPMLVGGRGYIPFGNGFTYYYSLTDLSTTGSIQIGAARFHVTGISWLDHQWGDWSWQTIRGWTWMALQLNNGVQLSVFDFRGTRTRIRAASVLLRNGTLRTEYGATITSSGLWVSPHSHGRYPNRWLVRIPALHTALQITPTVTDQELIAPGARVGTYWEGSGRVTGVFQGQHVTGLSYTELTGYAGGFAGG